MANKSQKANKPKQIVKNGQVYGDALSAQEKKRIVMQKKKDRKVKKIPKSAQQTIPYVEMCKDGICKVNSRLYTKTIRYNDINYQLAQNEDKTAIFENWCDFLNYFDSSIFVQLSFINQKADIREFRKQITIPEQQDAFNDIRKEYSDMLKISSPKATTVCSSVSTSPSVWRLTPFVPQKQSWIVSKRIFSTISKLSVWRLSRCPATKG